MERLHMNYLRDLIHRLRAGESERRISRDLSISRITVHRYHELAQRQGFLRPGSAMPEDEAIWEFFRPAAQERGFRRAQREEA